MATGACYVPIALFRDSGFWYSGGNQINGTTALTISYKNRELPKGGIREAQVPILRIKLRRINIHLHAAVHPWTPEEECMSEDQIPAWYTPMGSGFSGGSQK